MFQTKMRIQKVLSVLMLVVLTALAPASVATAACTANAQSCGSQYQVTESFFGAGGQYANCKPTQTYCARMSAGEQTVGQTCSTGEFCAQTGFNSDRSPSLELIINDTSVDAGVLTSDSTHVGQASFSIKTYLADGYQITTYAAPPTNAGHALATNGSHNASTLGIEQFGMNLRQNDCPGAVPATGNGSCSGHFGAEAACATAGFCNIASSTTIGANYNTPNEYYYPASGTDTLVTSSSSTGTTNFTMSYIFNVSNVTPAGTYKMNQSIIATSTF
jgi:hypothetical protein